MTTPRSRANSHFMWVHLSFSMSPTLKPIYLLDPPRRASDWDESGGASTWRSSAVILAAGRLQDHQRPASVSRPPGQRGEGWGVEASFHTETHMPEASLRSTHRAIFCN